MRFEPCPKNDFRRFYDTYFSRCKAVCPKLKAVAAKWTFEDLVPGLSDFDTRFIVADGTTLEDWHHLSQQVGRVHTELTGEVPHWARNLEHLPGLNLSVAEITNPLLYYPEFKQWSFYQGDRATIEKIEACLEAVPWSRRDQIYHLKKIATYFGPYQRGIDPPINLGRWENKYPLHSRYMHYFTPPVQAGVSLVSKKTVRGKFDALRTARDLFPGSEVIDMILDCAAAHYQRPDDYQEPRLSQIERELEDYLSNMWAALADHVSLITIDPADTRDTIRRKINSVPVDPVESFFEGVKFSRLMKGRLLFYAQRIPWFDSVWLIRNELARIVANFHRKPLQTYGRVRFGETLPPAQVVARLRGAVLSDADCEGLNEFARLADAPIAPGDERARARQVAGVYEAVLSSLEKISADLMARLNAG